jgi:hypothetical protein
MCSCFGLWCNGNIPRYRLMLRSALCGFSFAACSSLLPSEVRSSPSSPMKICDVNELESSSRFLLLLVLTHASRISKTGILRVRSVFKLEDLAFAGRSIAEVWPEHV